MWPPPPDLMRIAVDATAIPSQRVGAGNYIFKLLQGLAALDGEEAYVFSAKRAHGEELGLDRPRVELVPVDHPSRPLRLLWEQSGLPRQLHRRRVDLVHS